MQNIIPTFIRIVFIFQQISISSSVSVATLPDPPLFWFVLDITYKILLPTSAWRPQSGDSAHKYGNMRRQNWKLQQSAGQIRETALRILIHL